MKSIKKFLGIILILGIVTTFATSCKKYEDGGSIGKADKNVKSSWKLDSYHRNGTDETSQLLISGYTEEYKDGGVYTRSYTDTDGDPYSESGSWELTDEDSELNIKQVSSLELTNNNSTVSSDYYTILKLKKDELWYQYDNGGDTHEFHLTAQ
ncbi:MAG: hypothetical protein COC01_05070 [Bacteroidetes bacterium]|nr:hypothetical protein [Bacteroidia bacterium]PCH67804.1 MAG: hypothetical protein COC01_05070 [Bacteroidota bacterium]